MAGSLKEKLEGLRRESAELEETRRRNEERYRRLLEDQRELVCRFSKSYVFSFVNDAYCRFHGMRREDFIGRVFSPSVHKDDQPRVAGLMNRLSRESPVLESEHRVFLGDGDVRWMSWRIRMLFDGDDGPFIEYQAVGLDVTDRKRAEEQARLSEELARRVEEQNRELSTPLIPIADNVLAMPLIGRIDEDRARRVLETVLQGVVSSRADTVLLDVTGVTVVDEQVAGALVRVASAVALLGARAVLTGTQPHVAQTLVARGVDVRGMITLSSLKEGIAWAMQERASRGGGPRRGG